MLRGVVTISWLLVSVNAVSGMKMAEEAHPLLIKHPAHCILDRICSRDRLGKRQICSPLPGMEPSLIIQPSVYLFILASMETNIRSFIFKTPWSSGQSSWLLT
jgi:hypothetical protein